MPATLLRSRRSFLYFFIFLTHTKNFFISHTHKEHIFLTHMCFVLSHTHHADCLKLYTTCLTAPILRQLGWCCQSAKG